MARAAIVLAPPDLQIAFAHRLAALRKTHLQPALLETVATLDIAALDRELSDYASGGALKRLAGLGLRGETLFVTPMVLRARPGLLTYYRTLLGYSQKEFFKTGAGLGVFKRAEDANQLGGAAADRLDELCRALNVHGAHLLEGLEGIEVNPRFLSELSLLSIGPQFRGGRNNETGGAGIQEVFRLILGAVEHAGPAKTSNSASLTNAAGRQVVIKVAADPDIVILEQRPGAPDRPLVAMEVKAGTDASNIHNRIGEAEKSHLKAKARGFTECWTVVNVVGLDPAAAKQQSPTTHRFFTLSDLLEPGSVAHLEFAESIVTLTGVRSRPVARQGKPRSRRS